MAFKKMSKERRIPTRQWALVGFPGAGKSTFAAQMRGPQVVVDADQRYQEVAHLVAQDVYELSEDGADNVNPERIAELLRANMSGSGAKTVIVDSLSAIITPIVTQAMLDNEAGRNTNRVAAFKDKAMAMRLLQDAITGFGLDTLWIYHYRTGLDSRANKVTSTSISAVELARLRRSLNAELAISNDNGTYSVKVVWARAGKSGMTLTDNTGTWEGMPEKLEQAIYGGLTNDDMKAMAGRTPEKFSSPADAIAWGFETGAFRDAVHAQNAYDKLKTEKAPSTATEMWTLWIADVEERKSNL